MLDRLAGHNDVGRKPVLIIVHQENSTPGRIGVRLNQLGFRLDIRRTCLGHPLPETMEHHAGAIIFGGPMSANDEAEFPFLRREIDWINIPLRENAPYLGVCLGAQLMARTLGAQVIPHRAGVAEIGYYPIFPAADVAGLFDWPEYAYQWHTEGFDIPAGSELIISGPEEFPNQGMRIGETAYGIQFHPEVTLAMMHRWTVKGAYRFVLPGAQPAHQHFAGRWRYDAAIDKWLTQFLCHWLKIDPSGCGREAGAKNMVNQN